MFLFLRAGRRAQPYLGETECQVRQLRRFSVLSQEMSLFQGSSEGPRALERSLAEGLVFLPVKAFGKSMRAFFLDFGTNSTPGVRGEGAVLVAFMGEASLWWA